MFETVKYFRDRARRLKGLYEDKKNIESIMQQLQDEAPSLIKQIDIAQSVPEDKMAIAGAVANTATRNALWSYQRKPQSRHFSELPVFADFCEDGALVVFPKDADLSDICYDEVKIVSSEDLGNLTEPVNDMIRNLSDEYETEYVVGFQKTSLGGYDGRKE